MENVYSKIDVNAYVAKYMDENGCNLDEACEELGIDPSTVFTNEKMEKIFPKLRVNDEYGNTIMIKDIK